MARWNIRPVVDDQGNRFPSAADAARALGMHPDNFRDRLRRSAAIDGHVWRYADDPDELSSCDRRSRGGMASRGNKRKLDSYVVKRAYSSERVRPWEL